MLYAEQSSQRQVDVANFFLRNVIVTLRTFYSKLLLAHEFVGALVRFWSRHRWDRVDPVQWAEGPLNGASKSIDKIEIGLAVLKIYNF